MPNVLAYDPSRVILVVAIPPIAQRIEEFAPGSKIEVRFNEELFHEVADCHGADTRVMRSRFSGSCRFETAFGSADHIALTSILVGDVLLKMGVGAFVLLDKNENTMAGGAFSYLADNPPLERAEEPSSTAWLLRARRLLIAHGGKLA